MKKFYIVAVFIIVLITSIFLFLYKDENEINKRFLSKFGIRIRENSLYTENIVIPDEFDEFYKSYNALQIESGLSLAQYKGKTAKRYTYIMLNFPERTDIPVYVNVITVNSKPVGGDINSPELAGFLLPLSFLLNE